MEVLFGVIIYLIIGFFVIEYRCNEDIIFEIESNKSLGNYINKIFLWLPDLIHYLYIILK